MADFPYKYYIKDTETTIKVNYKLLDKDGEILTYIINTATGTEKRLRDNKNDSCFSSVTYNAIPQETKTIVIYHPLTKIPYDKIFIEKWVKELNDLGFPCKLTFNKQNAEFIIDLSEYKKKLHLNCAMQLVRCVTESYICFIPELYFNSIEKLPKTELDLDKKFDVLQDAHKSTKQYNESAYANTNHMITHKYNGEKNVTRDIFWARIKESKLEIYDNHGINAAYGKLNALWQG